MDLDENLAALQVVQVANMECVQLCYRLNIGISRAIRQHHALACYEAIEACCDFRLKDIRQDIPHTMILIVSHLR